MVKNALREPLSKVLRRKQQFQRAASTPFANKKEKKEPQDLIGHEHTEAGEQQKDVMVPLTSSTTSLRSQKSLQSALVNQNASAMQRKTIQAMNAMVSKKDIFETFSLLTSLANSESVDSATVKALSSSLVRSHLIEQVGEAVYSELLDGAVGSTDDRWQEVSAEEKRIFSLYHVKRLERYYEKGSSFNPLLGFTVEGTDNELVTLTEARLRKQSERSMLPVSSDVLGDLMHLDVSWTVALRLLTYAKELHPSVEPPNELRDRVTGLMTAYRSGGLGSRPWREALRLYDQSLTNGYETTLTTHTHALDALWRSGDSFHKVHSAVDKHHQEWIWNALLQVRRKAKEEGLAIRGDEGCAYMESLIKVAATAGRWEAAVTLLSDMDATEEEMSHRLLVPTAESFLFGMIACHVAHNAVFSASLQALFKLSYTWQSAHSEVLLLYLRSLRHVVRLAPWVGEVVEEILGKGRLDRLCAVACLQLLSSRHVHTTQDKGQLALRCFDSFDANSWSQQPLVRKIELQTVFRCCHIIESRIPQGCTLTSHLTSYFVSVFGKDSPEAEWLQDTEVYKLQELSDWEVATDIFRRQVMERPPERVKFLPLPVRQITHMYRHVLLRCARECFRRREGGEFFLDDDALADDSEETSETIRQCVERTKELYDNDFTSPEVLGELLTIQSLCAETGDERKRLAVRATYLFALAGADAVTPAIVTLLSDALSSTELHVEDTLIHGHAKLQETAFRTLLKGTPSRQVQMSALERVYD